MAISLRTNTLTFIYDGSLRKTNEFAYGVTAAIKHDWAIALANGTGSGNANFAWQDQITIAATANSVIDLRALTDEFGVAQVVTKVAVFAVRLTSNTPADVTGTLSVFGAAADPWAAPVGNVNDLMTVTYQGWLVLVSKTAAKYATSASSKNVKILNNSATAAATVDVVVVGEI